jgi:hypothetical protein
MRAREFIVKEQKLDEFLPALAAAAAPIASMVGRGALAAGQMIGRGALAAGELVGNAAVKGAQTIGQGVGRATQAVGNTANRAQAMGQGTNNNLGQKIGQGAKNLGQKIGQGLNSAGQQLGQQLGPNQTSTPGSATQGTVGTVGTQAQPGQADPKSGEVAQDQNDQQNQQAQQQLQQKQQVAHQQQDKATLTKDLNQLKTSDPNINVPKTVDSLMQDPSKRTPDQKNQLSTITQDIVSPMIKNQQGTQQLKQLATKFATADNKAQTAQQEKDQAELVKMAQK